MHKQPTAPQSINSSRTIDKFTRQQTRSQLISPWCRIYASMNQISTCLDNGLSPLRRQAIIQTNALSLSTGPLVTNFSEILIKIPNFSSTKWRPFCQMRKLTQIIACPFFSRHSHYRNQCWLIINWFIHSEKNNIIASGNMGCHWFRCHPGAQPTPRHHLNQCCLSLVRPFAPDLLI